VPRRAFTPEEANRALPLVRRIVDDLLERGRELKALAPKQSEPAVRDHVRELEREIQGFARELEAVGCSYKDWGFESGLVDFPSVIDGRPVLLCWKDGEQRVEWFHAPEAGFAGRTRIPERLLAPRAPTSSA
jgi:hypothetical protein